MDGTLANTERDGHRVAFNRAFAEAGLTWQWSVELYGELLAIAGSKERIRFYMDRDRPSHYFSPNLFDTICELGLDDVASIPVLCLIKVVERFRSRATLIPLQKSSTAQCC